MLAKFCKLTMHHVNPKPLPSSTSWKTEMWTSWLCSCAIPYTRPRRPHLGLPGSRRRERFRVHVVHRQCAELRSAQRYARQILQTDDAPREVEDGSGFGFTWCIVSLQNLASIALC